MNKMRSNHRLMKLVDQYKYLLQNARQKNSFRGRAYLIIKYLGKKDIHSVQYLAHLIKFLIYI